MVGHETWCSGEISLSLITLISKHLHCKYIDCQKYNFSWCNVSHALPVPFGHLITVPSTADKWYFQLYFWIYIFYIIQTVKFVQLNQCKNISKIQLFVVFQKYNDFVVFPMHIFAVYSKKWSSFQQIIVLEEYTALDF